MIDKFVMLEFLAAREEAQPGSYPSGGTLFREAAHLEPQPTLVMNNITRVLADLRRLGWIEWVFHPWPRDEVEPQPHSLTEGNMQQVHEISISDRGHQTLAGRRESHAGMQINFTNSTVGQLALGDINNVDLTTILLGAERQLDAVKASEEEKDRVRQTLHKLRDTGQALAVGASSELLATVLRKALGLG
jgi:hypothetical protein